EQRRSERGGREADPEHPRLAERRPVRLRLEPPGGRECGPGFDEERFPRGGERKMRAAPDQAVADQPFDLLALLAERRLGDPEPLGRASEMALLGKHGEVTELAQLELVHTVRI